MRLIGLFLVLMKWLFPQKLDSILILKWLMMEFHMDVLVLKSLTASTLTGHNTVGACIYKISGRGRKSSEHKYMHNFRATQAQKIVVWKLLVSLQNLRWNFIFILLRLLLSKNFGCCYLTFFKRMKLIGQEVHPMWTTYQSALPS